MTMPASLPVQTLHSLGRPQNLMVRRHAEALVDIADLRTEELYASLAVTSILGMRLNILLRRLEQYFILP